MENTKKSREKNYQMQAYLWNTISSILNAGMSALLLLVVSHISGEKAAGMFALAFSIAQLLVTIAYFEVRPYQVTDVQNKYSNSDYYTFKIITCILMLLFSGAYIYLGNYTGNKGILIALLCVFKLLDAFEDYYVALYQKNGRLDIGAKKSSIRVMISMLFFCLAMIIFRKIEYAVMMAIISSVIFILQWFVFEENKKWNVNIEFDVPHLFGIFSSCFPMFVGTYLMLYVGNAPKYAIDKYMEIQYQAYYGILYMPSFVINLFSGFVFKPMINDMAKYYSSDRKKYWKLVCKMMRILAIISLVVIVIGFFLGPEVLGWLYRMDLKKYRLELFLILMGGAIAALSVIIYYMIMIMRKQKWMIVSYIITAVSAYFLSPILVKNKGITGASVGFLFFNIIKIVIFIFILVIFSIREKVKEK